MVLIDRTRHCDYFWQPQKLPVMDQRPARLVWHRHGKSWNWKWSNLGGTISFAPVHLVQSSKYFQLWEAVSSPTRLRSRSNIVAMANTRRLYSSTPYSDLWAFIWPAPLSMQMREQPVWADGLEDRFHQWDFWLSLQSSLRHQQKAEHVATSHVTYLKPKIMKWI